MLILATRNGTYGKTIFVMSRKWYETSLLLDLQLSIARSIALQKFSHLSYPRRVISKAEYTEWKLNWPQTADECGKFKPRKQWRYNLQATEDEE